MFKEMIRARWSIPPAKPGELPVHQGFVYLAITVVIVQREHHPLGTPEFVTGLESLLGRRISRRAPGRKPAIEADGAEQLKLL